MIESISKNEKTDLLLALALAFEKNLFDGAAGVRSETGPATSAVGIADFFSAFSAEEAALIKEKAELFTRLPEEKQNLWQKIRLDKIRRRGISDRLDSNVHPVQIAAMLDGEPKIIQLLVLKNLPENLSRAIARNLSSKPAGSEYSAEPAALNGTVHDEIVELIRDHFVSNFVALEDLFEAGEIDKIPIQKLGEFIHHLGIRETAIACRGINSKETLAAFLNRFDEENAKQIAGNITELENVKPVWVERADRLLRKTLENEFQPETLLRRLGEKILAVTFVFRDASAIKFTAQKMLPFEAESWLEMVKESVEEYKNAPESDRQLMKRRFRVVERIAANFV